MFDVRFLNDGRARSRAGAEVRHRAPDVRRTASSVFFSAAGAKLRGDVILDGHDVLPVLRGEQPSPRKEMFWEFRGQKAARVANYKWIESDKAKGFYDLSADVGEKHDLSAIMPVLAADIRARWSVWRKQMGAVEPRGPFRDY